MTEAPNTIVPGGSAQPIIDVWSRASRKHRVRAVTMLLLLAVLFAGLCCFMFWLRTGVYWPWLSDTYQSLMAQSLQPAGRNQITLTDFLSAPISVTDVPIHGLIIGLLLATLGSIPLLVAILYRFPSSVIFAIMVMFLAAMPWLGLTVLMGCVLTSLRPFRFSFRYASAMIGLIPIAIYFVSASWEPSEARPRLIQQQALLYAPWVLAVLGSCVICAVALAFAKLINYRPGGVPLLLAILFALPVYLFHTQVGVDELDYRLLEQEIGPGSHSVFATVDLGAEVGRLAARRSDESASAAQDEMYRQTLKDLMSELLENIENDRARAAARCDSFQAHFPKSRYVPNVVFLKGRALDERAVLHRDNRVEFRSDMPCRASRTTWETLVERFPNEAASATAFYKLAILAARDGRLDTAVELLDKLSQRFDISRVTTQSSEPPPNEKASLFRKAPPSVSLGIDPTFMVRQARRLREMLVTCRGDAPRPEGELFVAEAGSSDELIHPMQLLLCLDDSDANYKNNLEELLAHFPDSVTRGYVEIRLALLAPPVSQRIPRFRSAAKTWEGTLVGAEALYYLGDSLQEDTMPEEASQVFEELVKAYPDSCWAQEARRRISSLALLTTPAE